MQDLDLPHTEHQGVVDKPYHDLHRIGKPLAAHIYRGRKLQTAARERGIVETLMRRAACTHLLAIAVLAHPLHFGRYDTAYDAADGYRNGLGRNADDLSYESAVLEEHLVADLQRTVFILGGSLDRLVGGFFLPATAAPLGLTLLAGDDAGHLFLYLAVCFGGIDAFHLFAEILQAAADLARLLLLSLSLADVADGLLHPLVGLIQDLRSLAAGPVEDLLLESLYLAQLLLIAVRQGLQSAVGGLDMGQLLVESLAVARYLAQVALDIDEILAGPLLS